MSKVRAKRVPLARRRGVAREVDTTRVTVLVRADDVDTAVDPMVAKKLAGDVRRDVGKELLAGKVREPAGNWALLVKLKGQKWLYFVDRTRDFDSARELAARTGLTTMAVGYERVSGSRFMQVFEGRTVAQRFESAGLDMQDPKQRKELRAAVGKSKQRPWQWWEQFRDELEIMDALVCEREAYVPWMWAGAKKGIVTVQGVDDQGALAPGDYERIDLLALGPGGKLSARNPADDELKDAIEEGDLARVRKAIMDGANLGSKLPGGALGALEMAVGGYVGWRSRKSPTRAAGDMSKVEAWLEVTRSLLEAGASADGTGHDVPPVGMMFENLYLTDAQVVEGLKLLLDHGADACARTTSGIPAVHLAAEKGRLDSLRFLHERGVNLACKRRDGKTARQYVEELIRTKRLTWMNLRVAKKVVAFLKSVEK